MADIAWTAPELTGETGLTLYLYTTAGVLINTGGDALSESPASSGRFVATVAETISDIASARLHDAVGPVRDGWLAVGSTLVLDGYPTTSAGDASQTTLLAVKAKTDLIGTAQANVALTAAAVLDVGTISGFPSELIVGDSYDSDSGEIEVTILDAEGDPITSMGSLDFDDADIEFTAYRTGDPSSMHLSGTCTYTASVVSITLPSSVTALGKPEFTYEGRLKFIWTAADAQKTFKTTQFKFVENP
jgi:hypothetical protein